MSNDDITAKESIRRRIQNEEDFRQFNVQTRRTIEAVMDDESKRVFPLGMLCECSDPNCLERIELTIAQRRSIRQHPNYFVIIPGHQDPQIEVVREQHQAYYVVEKLQVNQ